MSPQPSGAEPTWSLVVSQVVLSFGIPMALIPLTMSTGNKALRGRYTDGLPLRIASILSATIIIILNLFLVYLTLTGQD